MFLKCHTCKNPVPVPRVGSNDEPIHFKWKDKTHMVKVVACKDCWNRAKSLKVPDWKK